MQSRFTDRHSSAPTAVVPSTRATPALARAVRRRDCKLGSSRQHLSWLVCGVLLALVGQARTGHGAWPLHTIDRSSRGADGVRLADINRDGLPDIVTGWEEGGRIRICLNPGRDAARQLWPSLEVGRVASPEDAVFADVDNDGDLDVVSCCEGRNRTIFVHFNPNGSEEFDLNKPWSTVSLPASQSRQQWMFCLPLQIDGRGGIDLVTGSKGTNAQIGWWQSPANAERLEDWKFHPLRSASWIMSLISHDMDRDGDQDILFSDRKGDRRGIFWLENPGAEAAASGTVWKEHLVGGSDHEVMFLKLGHLCFQDRIEIVSAVRNGPVLVFAQPPASTKSTSTSGDRPQEWSLMTVPMPPDMGTGKGIGLGDLDQDGLTDIAVTCENAKGQRGVVVLKQRTGASPEPAITWQVEDVSGKQQGIKYDRVELLDLDGDGDLDILTCEERDNLGVIWYENPRPQTDATR